MIKASPILLLKVLLTTPIALTIMPAANSSANAQDISAVQSPVAAPQQPNQQPQQHAQDEQFDDDMNINSAAGMPATRDRNGHNTIVVTGTHIRGGIAAGANVQVFTREDIDRSGFATVHEFMSTITQNFSGSGATEDFSPGPLRNSNHYKGAAVDLRGLGPDSTLVLINGRRTAPSGLGGDFVDVSTIPQSAIARVEVLTDGASALYGSDAVSGVVNFILRQDYEGAETRVRYGRVTEGKTDEYRLSQTVGTNWNGGHVLAVYEYYKRDALQASDRKFSQTRDLRSRGGQDYRSPAGNPGNILDPATFQPAYAIPTGQDGRNLVVSDLLPGQINSLDVTPGETLLPKQKRHSGYLAAEHALSQSVSLFGEARYSERKFASVVQPLMVLQFVPVTNAFYPESFGTGPLIVQTNLEPDLGPNTQTGRVRSLAATGGITASISDWRLQSYVNFSRERSTINIPFFNQAAMMAALADSNPETALNVFGDGKVNNPQTIQGLLAKMSFNAHSRITSANAVLDGPLFSLLGRNVSLAIGTEYRWEKLRSKLLVPPSPTPIEESLSRNIKAAFAEFYFPFVTQDERIPLISSLGASIAARYDKYSDVGGSTNPKLGVQYAPFSGFQLNATYGTSFRAPNLSELSTVNNVATVATAVDPRSPTGRSRVLLVDGKDPNTEPENAKTWTFGFLLRPPQLPGLSASLNYASLRFKDRITSTEETTETMLAFSERFPGIVIRNPSASLLDKLCSENLFVEDPSTCTPAFIDVAIDQRSRNVARTNVRSLDGSVTYSFDIDSMQLILSGSATYLLEHSFKQTEEAMSIERVDTYGYPVDFRARASASFGFEGITAYLALNYTDSYKNPTSMGSRKIESSTTFDLNIGIQFNGDFQPDAQGRHLLALSVVNLFDVDPPFVDTFWGYDGANADPLGRFIALEFKISW